MKDERILDLKFCLENFNYPPKLPKDIFWTRPDNINISNIEKDNLVHKYNFDRGGKVTTYFYQGSWISVIFPLPYSFSYDKKKPELIDKIIDVFYTTKYLIKYDELIFDGLKNKIH